MLGPMVTQAVLTLVVSLVISPAGGVLSSKMKRGFGRPSLLLLVLKYVPDPAQTEDSCCLKIRQRMTEW